MKTKKGCVKVKIDVYIDKKYMVDAISWGFYINDITPFSNKEKVALYVSNYAQRYGNAGWRGSTDAEQTIGADTADKYNNFYEQAMKYVETNFPFYK